MREAKHTSWKAFVSSLSRSTRSDAVWNRLRRMSDKCNRTLIPSISVGGAVITSQADMANTIASSFSLACSLILVLELLRTAQKHCALILHLVAQKLITSPSVWMNCCNTSPDPVGIHNEMLSHLPPSGKEFLLSIYNRIWTEISVPDSWREAAVIPVLKPGKDCSLAISYGPISLTSCLCKTMERTINRCLVRVLES
jgi:potassium voltage-gated channel Eag-related subfamily H protein 8